MLNSYVYSNAYAHSNNSNNSCKNWLALKRADCYKISVHIIFVYLIHK